MNRARRTVAKAAAAAAGLTMAALGIPAAAHAVTPYGNFEMQIQGRYDFHTWLWAVSRCRPEDPVDCLQIQGIPQPNARAFPYKADANLVDGRYVLAIDMPEGLRCGNVYYGPVIPTRDVYSWDPVTLEGEMNSSFAVGCDGAPGGTFTYPFRLVRL
ncbi:hypothetical protein MMUR_35010 [Mycolicibacterium murale]|jgi:hypothetical protein|uniref:Secreted protein n=1 Tax=Mycolicibacterium murale TaxID=182220 RepID=A0A7I9WNP3_9MYCO|nr:hypothetical protein [Mycolicibacterium murale]GFG59365.1 hypothetical protein MMUR_35010 [Mycolicibacterium murale]